MISTHPGGRAACEAVAVDEVVGRADTPTPAVQHGELALQLLTTTAMDSNSVEIGEHATDAETATAHNNNNNDGHDRIGGDEQHCTVEIDDADDDDEEPGFLTHGRRSISKSMPDILTPNEVHSPSKLILAFNQDAALTPATPYGGVNLVGPIVGIAPMNQMPEPSTSSGFGGGFAKNGWLNGIMGCIRPMLNMIGKNKYNESRIDEWEIPFDSIRDLQWLGSGAQGAVFLGRINGELVAVKKVKDKVETDIKHLRKLNHENIIAFKGVCTQDPCYCIVMEYCPYGQLYDVLKAGSKTITPAVAVHWAKQIASGMLYLHQHKIIHRDLKSPNVLLSYNDVLKITDFGIRLVD